MTAVNRSDPISLTHHRVIKKSMECHKYAYLLLIEVYVYNENSGKVDVYNNIVLSDVMH